MFTFHTDLTTIALEKAQELRRDYPFLHDFTNFNSWVKKGYRGGVDNYGLSL